MESEVKNEAEKEVKKKTATKKEVKEVKKEEITKTEEKAKATTRKPRTKKTEEKKEENIVPEKLSEKNNKEEKSVEGSNSIGMSSLNMRERKRYEVPQKDQINLLIKKSAEQSLEKKPEKRGLITRETGNKSILAIERENTIGRISNSLRGQVGNIFGESPVKIIPLGGLEEIGKNMTLIEYEGEIIIIDSGLEFPEDEMLGVDMVIPDMTYLEQNKFRIKGLVVTHGHEDHIGSIPYLLKQINVPIYATKLTIGLIKNKLEEHNLLSSAKLNIVKQGETIKLGKIKVEFIRSCHSIPDSVMLAIHTRAGTIVHTGDFKVDYTPIDDEKMDLGRLAELGQQGVLALMSDSTNAERKGFTMSESTVGEVFEKLFSNCTKRIVVATFASNVHRVQQIVDSAVRNKRKVAVCGRSMINMITTAKELGYIKVPDNTFIDIDMINNYTDEQLVLITTGSQGEPMSALTRMASGEHKKVEITPNDLVIISATAIPGNEKLVSKVIDDLMKIGAEVVYSALEAIHVSGHACQEEQKLILSLVKPKYFIPVHGEYRQLQAHAQTARKVGVDPKNIFMLQNGRVLELSKDASRNMLTVPSGKILVDGLGVGDVGTIVLRDRQHLSQDGLIIVVMTMDAAIGQIIAGPDVITRGFVYVRESENLMDEVKKVVRLEVVKLEKEGITEWGVIKSSVKDTLKEYIFQKTKRNPMILPIIMEV